MLAIFVTSSGWPPRRTRQRDRRRQPPCHSIAGRGQNRWKWWVRHV